MRSCKLLLVLLIASVVVPATGDQANAGDQPNILWITSEDNGPELGCYGDDYATTPNIDALAARGMRYANCWSNAPVCAPARTTIITGLYPTSFGGQHMRSQVTLPSVAKLYPQYFRDAGYYCTNNSKTDYNFDHNIDEIWNESSRKAHWRNRQEGQPFFAVFNFTISHESKLRTRPHKAVHDAAQVTVPDYHPDTPEVRQDWAQYYDRLTEMDREVGKVLKELEADGLRDNTIIFYYGDHGSGMPRGKRWLYQSGLRVPMIVSVPDRLQSLVENQYEVGAESDRLISFVDLAPTVLSLAGIEPPEHLHGKVFLGPYATEDPQYIYGFRDRMDERYDMSRAIRDGRYMYIRNFYPHRPQGTYLEYMFQTPTTQVWKRLFEEGKLNEAQSVFWKRKAPEELYDLANDQYQTKNLADSEEHTQVLNRMRSAVRDWMIDIKDVGLLPEGEMISRSKDSTPYEMARNEQQFPVEDLYRAADLASRANSNDLDRLLQLGESSDSGVRFWVANGLLHRASIGRDNPSLLVAARNLATDDSAYVRCIANETLVRFGDPEDRPEALDRLVDLADAKKHSTFVAMTALNGLDWCRPSAKELPEDFSTYPAHDGQSAKRYNGYVPRLLKRVESIAD